MSFIEQMDLVYKYYKPFIGKMNSFIDVYLVTFFPNALNKDESYVFQTKNLSASLSLPQLTRIIQKINNPNLYIFICRIF
jgi:hypothetical protein